MTKKQMISTLRGMDFGSTIGSKGDEALRMEIDALEQQPTDDAIKHEYDTFCSHKCEKCVDAECPLRCEDAISREAVIEIICRETEWYDIRTQINELPSVTPSITRDIEKSNFSQEQYLLDTDSAYQIGYEKGKKDSRHKGHWIQIDYQRNKFECSECHTQGYVDTCMYEPKWKYCPICGSYNGGDEIGRSAEMVSKRCKGELYEGEFDEMESEE